MNENNTSPEKYTNPQYLSYVKKESVRKREYSFAEMIFAWICFFMGYLFCRVFPVVLSPLGGFLFVIALFAVTAVFLKLKKVRFGVMPCVMAAVAIAFSASLILSSNSFLYWLAYVFALATYCAFVYRVCGNSVRDGFSGFIAADYFNAVFSAPFASVQCAWKAAFSGEAAGKLKKTLIKILCGIAVAVIPTAIVGGLLSYDDGFNKIMGKIFDFDMGTIFGHIGSMLIGFLVGMYLFGLYVSSVDKYTQGALTEEILSEKLKKMRIAHVLTVAVASVPLLFVYVVFFISQWQYYVSGFTGVLPEEFSYAEYAREGFFQLCAVAFINLAVIIIIGLLAKRREENTPVLIKIITVVFSLFTLVLISTAISKMAMYIGSYGLTQKRVYSTCMMVVLAVVFVLIILKQFIPKIAVAAFSLAASVLLFAVLSLGNIDAVIAGYNVDRYIDGSLPTVDIEAMDDLGDAAIPELVRLANYMDEKNGTDISKVSDENRPEGMYGELAVCLRDKADDIVDDKKENKGNIIKEFFAFNVPAKKAEKALIQIGYLF